MTELLIELRGLELPPEEQRRGLERLARAVFEELMGGGTPPSEVVTFSTPRRLGLWCVGLPAGEAGGALAGRLTAGLPALLAQVGDGPLPLEHDRRRGPELVGQAEEAPLPEQVEWGGGRRGRRPLDGVVVLLGGEVLPVAVDGVAAGRVTAGHRWLSPEPIAVESGDAYFAALRERGVEPVFALRVDALAAALAARAGELGGELRGERGDSRRRLLRRAAGLVEIPGAVGGEVDPDFLALPPELFLAALGRLPAFAVVAKSEGAKGELLPRFVAPVDRLDDPDGRVRAGLEAAVAGLLADARFAWERDRREPLVERARRLDRVTFHRRLGSYAEKLQRLRALVAPLIEELGSGLDAAAVRDAVELLKADLTTATVRGDERLRGVVGGLLAREEGYVEAVWRAVADQHRPEDDRDAIPAGRVGRLVAVADRLDTLVGLVGLGVPLGPHDRDPLALRQRADGLLRILVEGELELDLDLVTARAVRLYGDRLPTDGEEVVRTLRAFFDGRLRRLLGVTGFAHDEIEAALAVRRPSLPELVASVRAIQTVRREPAFAGLVVASRRIAEIVQDFADLEIREDRLADGAERELQRAVTTVRVEVDAHLVARRPEDALRAMTALLPAVDRFFADVLVMDEDLERRHDRVALLQAVRRILGRVGRLRDVVVDEATPAAVTASWTPAPGSRDPA